jgi:hypothetical protein
MVNIASTTSVVITVFPISKIGFDDAVSSLCPQPHRAQLDGFHCGSAYRNEVDTIEVYP